MRRNLFASMSLILSMGLVGCAANNPTRDADVIRDTSVENRIRDGEALSTSREAAERSAQRQKDKSTSYGSQPGAGGSRKTTPGTKTTKGSDLGANDSTTKATSETAGLGSLASLLGKSSGGSGSGMGMWLAAGAALLAVKGGDLLSGGGKGLNALLGADKKDSKDSKDSKSGDAPTTATSDLRGSGSGSAGNTGGEVSRDEAAKSPPMKPEGSRPTDAELGAKAVAKMLHVQLPLEKADESKKDSGSETEKPAVQEEAKLEVKTEPAKDKASESAAPSEAPSVKPNGEAVSLIAKAPASGFVIRLRKKDGSVSLIDENGIIAPEAQIETAPKALVAKLEPVENQLPTGTDADPKAEQTVILEHPFHPSLEKTFKSLRKGAAQ